MERNGQREYSIRRRAHSSPFGASASEPLASLRSSFTLPFHYELMPSSSHQSFYRALQLVTMLALKRLSDLLHIPFGCWLSRFIFKNLLFRL